jgi:NADPH:quinone reductase
LPIERFAMMLAVVAQEPGGPEVLRIEERPIPRARRGWVLVRVRAFGLNYSELLTRAGRSGEAVRFPCVLGTECVGEIMDAPGSDLARGQRVLAMRGGMGRDYDGCYVQYALLPANQAIPVQSTLAWTELGAIPESFGTAWAMLEELALHKDQSLLVHGGNSPAGKAAIALAKDRGHKVLVSTRHEAKRAILESAGADYVILLDDELPEIVRALLPGGVNGLCEPVGPPAAIEAIEALHALSPNARACINRAPGSCPSMVEGEAQRLGVTLRHCNSPVIDRDSHGEAFQSIVEAVQDRRYTPDLDRVFQMSEIAEAHRYMEENPAVGKIVVLPPED